MALLECCLFVMLHVCKTIVKLKSLFLLRKMLNMLFIITVIIS